jgi:hypothetical protein
MTRETKAMVELITLLATYGATLLLEQSQNLIALLG